VADYTALITSQHANKPKFRAMVESLAGAIGDITAAIQSIPQQFDIDDAVGKQLDIAGEWVGQSRVVTGVLTLGYFGFADNLVAKPFGEEGNAAIGGRFWEEGEPFTGTAVLADPEYRLVLKAKIIRNHYDGSGLEEIEDALQILFGVPGVVRDDGSLNLDIVVHGPISLVGQSLLTNFDILPRPAGVAIRSIIYTDMAAQARDVATMSATFPP
jgi:hypothetical protein